METVRKRAMVMMTVTRVVGKQQQRQQMGDGDGNEGGGQQRG